MELITNAPKGTQDILTKDSYKWQIVEDVMRRVSLAYGFKEIRTPVFEHTDLFVRSVGQTSDVVQKEMYTFNDKGNRSITLRPEGTAGAVRAILEHGVYNEGLPIKAYYFDSCYRYEKPQAGRLREFHQFGVEVFGAGSALADAEIIALAKAIFDCLGLSELQLEINSIGCKKCRQEYYKALKDYFKSNIDNLCSICKERLDKNPMRILDCKNDECKSICENAPVMLDFLCDECREHFESVKEYLNAINIEFNVNPKIVRGLDYYTRTVFEFVSSQIGAQATVCGGGRYDGLVREIGGPDMPSLGFGIGMERLLLLLDRPSTALTEIEAPRCDVYIASVGEEARKKAFNLVENLRTASITAECDLSNKSLKAQLKYANKIKAKFSIVIGETELESNNAKVKNMQTGELSDINLDENFIDKFTDIYFSNVSNDIDV